MTLKNNAIYVGVNGPGDIAMKVNQTINFSKYRQIQYGIHRVSTSFPSITIRAGVIPSLNSNNDNFISESTISLLNKKPGTLLTSTIDVSAVTGSYYFGISQTGGSASANIPEVYAVDYIKLIP